jgi:hypothetical protein
MINTDFPTFQTQSILDFSSASRSGTLGFAFNTEIFQYKDVASGNSGEEGRDFATIQEKIYPRGYNCFLSENKNNKYNPIRQKNNKPMLLLMILNKS